MDTSSEPVTFTWEGLASDLVVGQDVFLYPTPTDLNWAIQCDDAISWAEEEGYEVSAPDRCIASGVVYGEANTAYEFDPALPLVAGETYDVLIAQWCDSEDDPYVALEEMIVQFQAP